MTSFYSDPENLKAMLRRWLAERNRLSMVVEIAIQRRLKEPPRKALPRPTIDELEKILNSDEEANVEIRPDGTIEVAEPTFARDLAEVALAAIYADGWKIVEQEEKPAPQSNQALAKS